MHVSMFIVTLHYHSKRKHFSLYFALVHPYYEYANIVWAVRNTVVLQKLFITRKRAVYVITNSSCYAHTYPLFRKTHILTIQELHKLQVACFMFKVDKGLMPPYFSSVFCINADVHSYNTRFASNYHITVHWTSLLHYTIRIAGPLLWNSLDSNIKSNQFKYF